MSGCFNVKMNGHINEHIYRWIGAQIDICIYKQIHQWTDGEMHDRCADAYIEGQIHRYTDTYRYR